MIVGDHVLTSKGWGVIKKFTPANGFVDRDDQLMLVVVKLDDKPESTVWPVFYPRDVLTEERFWELQALALDIDE